MNTRSIFLIAGLCYVPTAAGQVLARVSVASTGAEGNQPSTGASMSSDARFVAFESAATNLIPGDVNDQSDVFVRDRLLGTTELITQNSQGQLANFGGEKGVISASGRFVAFSSWADDLVVNDANGWMDVFVRDRVLGTTECISLDVLGSTANRISRNPALSGDGRFVAFESRATDLVSTPDVNAFLEDVFVCDRTTGVIQLVSVDSSGTQGNSVSRAPSISADGRYVAFESAADNLVSNDTNGTTDVFVRDLGLGTTVRASISSAGSEADLASSKPFISADGRFVAFESMATNLAGLDANGNYDIYVHDMQTGLTVRGSVDSSGLGGVGDSFEPRLTPDGRLLAFASYAHLDAGDTNAEEDVFVRDMSLGKTLRVSVSSLGQQLDYSSIFPALSADGRTVAFTTVSRDVVPGDMNEADDVFVNKWSTDWTAVCLGDGTGMLCPCGNSSSTSEQAGCANALGTGGSLTASGTASIASDTFVLRGVGMPNGPVLYFQGTGTLGSGLGSPFGDGLLCANGATVRLGVKFNSGGASNHPVSGDVPIATAGSCTAGAVRVYQGWYRDARTFCTGAGFNLTNGVILTWEP